MRIRTLRQLSKLINDLNNGYKATVFKWTSNTDTRIPGTRLRQPGRGRKGLRIEVYNPQKKLVLDHTSSDTYRTVDEAIVKAIDLFGEDKLNVDPNETLKIGDEVRIVNQFLGQCYANITKVRMRRGSKTRVKKYEVLLQRGQSKVTFASRYVTAV